MNIVVTLTTVLRSKICYMHLASGGRVGPYEILGLIGAGGMGEVYKARDTRVDRFVAVKISKTEFSERFEREARAVAALNHPNICQLYDLGRLPDGGGYLVMEYVEGSPIAPVDSPRKLLDIAVQIADGLAAAHSAGITHRDLKPDNILVSGPASPHPGRVKILDFGLARYTPGPSQSDETQVIGRITNPGSVMGTVAYMSPEQARGAEVDARSDQFSFGLIVYELATGRRAFEAGNPAETMAAIIRAEAEPLPASVPAPLRWIVERCLAKDPAERYDSTRDLFREVKNARDRLTEASRTGPAVPAAVGRPRRVWVIAGLAGLAIAAAAFNAARLVSRSPNPPIWSGTMLGGSEIAINPRLSPDGNLLAFQAVVQSVSQIAIMKPESGNWSILTRDRQHGPVNNHTWSADGTLIYYDRYAAVPQGTYSVPVLGGDERLVLGNAFSPEALPDGSLLVVMPTAGGTFQLHRFWPDTGRLQPLPIDMGQNAFQVRVRARRDGRTAVAWGEPIGGRAFAPSFYLIDLASGLLRRLDPHGATTDEGGKSFTISADGRSVLTLARSGALTRIFRFPIEGAEPPSQLVTTTAAVWYLDAGPDGSVYASMVDRPAEVVRFAPDGSRTTKLASFSQVPESATITVLPDGRAVLPIRASSNVRVIAVQEGKEPAALVNTTEETAAPLALCGPHEIALTSGPEPHESISIAEPASGRLVRTIAPGKGRVDSIACSPDGKTVYFVARNVVWATPSSGPRAVGEARSIRTGDSVAVDPSGRRLIVQSKENAQLHRFIVPLDGGSEREIPMDGSNPVAPLPLSANALDIRGRLLTALLLRDAWFVSPAIIDTVTGRITRIPGDSVSDYSSMAWTPDGYVVALKLGLRPTLWRFRPVHQ
jgi:tRNA A-37 threonylcarbamoyl transferase component Bud32